MEFISPTGLFETSFLRFYKDFELTDPKLSAIYAPSREGFKSYVKQLRDDASDLGRLSGDICCHHYWLINEFDEVTAVLRIRHHIDKPQLTLERGNIELDVSPRFRKQGITKQALIQAKEKLKQLNIESISIKVDKSNTVARKAIESNGGVADIEFGMNSLHKSFTKYNLSTESFNSQLQ